MVSSTDSRKAKPSYVTIHMLQYLLSFTLVLMKPSEAANATSLAAIRAKSDFVVNGCIRAFETTAYTFRTPRISSSSMDVCPCSSDVVFSVDGDGEAVEFARFSRHSDSTIGSDMIGVLLCLDCYFVVDERYEFSV